ncbi:DivIVA domain-containing protein [Conexibacter sp. SYSU D00693]|uniref:DivIVA domain-containing protein n=1 Tax=Conexibacter sp. SYSU D00693 TaxID=2812560 RepID=UPI00196B992B|nr:DivIVA domain-containing protein [Conexibacter sp. SYSU D00693]
MALDRQSIEKRDFPIGRRGYEPEAVDAHLATVAEEVDRLRRSASRQKASPASIAQAASEQVRAIVEAAESSAAEIERSALDEADRIRNEAESDARETRDDALRRNQEQVGRVREATQLMLQRVDAMESELTALMESLRTGANRLNADLSLLEGNLGELQDAATSGGAVSGGRIEARAVEAPAAPPAAPAPVAEAPAAPEPEPAPPVAEPAPTEAFDLPPVAEPEPAAAPASGGGDVEGARLVALNMALNGQSREETDRYLAENFDLADRGALLDEVYSTVEG